MLIHWLVWYVLPDVESFNSLFEMRRKRSRQLRMYSDAAFNSLFEMPVCRPRRGSTMR